MGSFLINGKEVKKMPSQNSASVYQCSRLSGSAVMESLTSNFLRCEPKKVKHQIVWVAIKVILELPVKLSTQETNHSHRRNQAKTSNCLYGMSHFMFAQENVL